MTSNLDQWYEASRQREREYESKVYGIVLPIKYTNDDLNSIVVNGYEGGINYWVKRSTVNHPTLPDWNEVKKTRLWTYSEWMFNALVLGGSVVFLSDDDYIGELDLEKLSKAFEERIRQLIDWGRDTVVTEGKIESTNLDAEDANWIIQQACFGEVIYG